jgi:hypothetical protein
LHPYIQVILSGIKVVSSLLQENGRKGSSPLNIFACPHH